MKSIAILRRAFLSLLPVVVQAAPLHAQTPAMTFAELRTSLQLREGESIEVIENNGSGYKARMNAISDSTLGITADGVRRDLAETQVREIRHKRPEKWWNGMLIGLGAGLAAAAVGVSTECGSNDSECSAITTAVFVPVFSGIGMGAGAAIDFAIKKQEAVFARPGNESRSLRITPILSKKTAGVAIVLGF
jgi:hypothetical protein